MTAERQMEEIDMETASGTKTDAFLKRVELLQSELKAPKNNYNNFGKYKYRSCEDIFEAVKPLTKKYNLVLHVSDDLMVLDDKNAYVRATATLTDIETPSYTLSSAGWARIDGSKKGMDAAQITGSASSYARKYALNGLLLIDDTKDSDYTNTGDKQEPQPYQRKAEASESPRRKAALQLWEAKGQDPHALREYVYKKTGKTISKNTSDSEWADVLDIIKNDSSLHDPNKIPLNG